MLNIRATPYLGTWIWIHQISLQENIYTITGLNLFHNKDFGPGSHSNFFNVNHLSLGDFGVGGLPHSSIVLISKDTTSIWKNPIELKDDYNTRSATV